MRWWARGESGHVSFLEGMPAIFVAFTYIHTKIPALSAIFSRFDVRIRYTARETHKLFLRKTFLSVKEMVFNYVGLTLKCLGKIGCSFKEKI